MSMQQPYPVVLCSLVAGLVLVAGCSSAPDRGSSPYPPELGVVMHAQWGWEPIEGDHATHRISRITIHHGGEDFPPEKDPVEYLRHLQSWSRTEKGWIDIPYHFMIDLSGIIYEARPLSYPGDTNTGYDPTGHGLICVMGNYEDQILSPRQLQSVVRLTAFLAERYAVPIGQIKGHKDYAETLCPGKDLYRYLQDGTIHAGVNQILHGQ
ncbi:MAG: peptidoglycan recognition protein family protein [Ignavibacteria bacterium]|nr:peptidoglycan recognition protein family protein [Ignavibacteria bacterium]